ncbi:hypothetical protein [Ruminococcus flavefaciens]|uniref:hypothetical protein n=1 Tax=Ruminococcus flavefaciens TaxID=1265 RepID=UPI0026EFD246|nr:hypothetical protein [Ruminococcus flavefaciens]
MSNNTKNTLPEPIPVDSKKLIDGLGTIFGGVIQLLGAMEPGMAQTLSDMAINGVAKEKVPEEINPDDFEEILAADDLPWDTEPEQKTEPPKPKAPAKKKSEQTALTADDLIRVVTQKIKKDRSNKDKVLALLKSYGAAKVSDIPQDKYEAFLTDVSQL